MFPQFLNIPFKKKVGHTVHLALIREDDLPAATWGVDGEGFLEALLDIRSPDPFRIILQGFVKRVPQLLTPTPRGGSWHPLCRRGEMMGRGPESSGCRAQIWRKGPWKKGSCRGGGCLGEIQRCSEDDDDGNSDEDGLEVL